MEEKFQQPPRVRLAHQSQFSLLKQRRFAPFFWVQFLGAAADNVLKFALTVMVTYKLEVSWLPASLAGLVIGTLFILPFLLFSATCGQLADKYPKDLLIRFVKNLEIGIMAFAMWGFVHQNIPVLLACIFSMGLHSTLFGPLKFSYLPQHLSEHELTGGNGLVEMGTFVAILLGNVVGGVLIALPDQGVVYVSWVCMCLAVLGRVLAQRVPLTLASAPTLTINWNPFSETWRNLRLAHSNLVVFRSFLGISWMWFFGAVFLNQLPVFAHDVLHGTEQVASALLVIFSVGIACGALLCERLSRQRVEIGLVPLGAIGMTFFSVDLYFSVIELAPVSARVTIGDLISTLSLARVLFDLGMLALSAGIYSVPMYSLIQMRSERTHRARLMATNNILNALFIIISSVLVGMLLKMGLSVEELFLCIGVLNALVAIYIFLLVPEYLLRFISWILSHLVYRFDVRGEDHIPAEGPAVLVCNHVSYVDAVLLMAASPRPIRFVMDYRIFQVPMLGWLFKLVKAIPIAPRYENPQAYQLAMDEATKVLRDGDLLGIFPEGNITCDGKLQPFKGGVMKILFQAQCDGLTHVRVVPMALNNLWGSFFSRIELRNGIPTAMVKPFRRGVFNSVQLEVAASLTLQDLTLEKIEAQVKSLQR